MRPRFGQLTKVLSVVLVVTGAGACYSGLNSGSQTTPGAADNGIVLLLIGAVYLMAGVGLWFEAVWAWWLGASLSAFVVVADLALGVRDGGLLVWTVVLGVFVISAAQGYADRPTTR
jgi:hypothetical protein